MVVEEAHKGVKDEHLAANEKSSRTYSCRSSPILVSPVELDELAQVGLLRRGAGEVFPFLDQDREATSVNRKLQHQGTAGTVSF